MLDLSAAFAAFPVLETNRFLLRAATLDDVADIFRVMSDPQVTRYFGTLPMTTPAQAQERVQAIEQAFHEQNGVRWVIVNRASRQLIGSCGFWRLIKLHDRSEIGYELAPDWWGRGVMTEAVGAMLQFGFTRMRLHTVEAQIHPANSGSRRVLEKLGFVQEGYFRENFFDVVEACFTDTAVYSLLKDSWMRRADV
ncbi:MAG: GNAT family N-acetyltransferase [Chloroflexota bacterium]|nr:GNAT family N-acetyltransferase [Chloroflexota bacterium]